MQLILLIIILVFNIDLLNSIILIKLIINIYLIGLCLRLLI